MRLIDADRLKLGFQVADKTLGLHGMLPFIEQGIDHAPTETERTATKQWAAIDPFEYNCSKCGKFLNNSWKYCPNCGSKFAEVDK